MRLLLRTAVVSMALTAPAGLTGAASATPSHWETGTFEFGPDVYENFCGLTVEDRGAGVFRFRTTTHGPDGFSYDTDFEDWTETLTNVDTGESVTASASFQSFTHRITDNGDGTLSVISQGPGVQDTFNQAGQRIFHRAGLTVFELLFDHAGTPTDPSDDEFLSITEVKQTKGFDNSDFCGPLIEAIG